MPNPGIPLRLEPVDGKNVVHHREKPIVSRSRMMDSFIGMHEEMS